MALAGARLLPETPLRTLEQYLTAGGGEGLLAALDRDPAEVVAEVERSGLRGRGGAGFPTGVKWSSVIGSAKREDTPVYLVANGAEGEPGTYKDRALMATNPFQVLEGVLVALHASGAARGYVCVKQRAGAALEALAAALEELKEAGWQGADRIELVAGPDEYLYGEEKAMLEVIEGKLPFPRILPPYEQGLFATMQAPNPTIVNNVETLANVPLIVARGATWFREVGSDGSPGTMIFTVVGDVANPGVYELPLGTTLRRLLFDVAGASEVKAVYSGTSNTVITPELLDLPLGFDEFAAAGTGLGSGGFVVYDESHCIVAVLATLSRFLAVESCGQCLACKLGTAAITELLDKVCAGDADDDDLRTIAQRTATVTDLNRCYLPVGEQLMVGSTMERFGAEFTAHLGTPCRSDRSRAVPKIEVIDPSTGEVSFDRDYHRKRLDWSYADE